HARDAARDGRIEPGRGRGLHRAAAGDHELRHHLAGQARLCEQLVLVAVAELRVVLLDVAADDRLVEIAVRLGLAVRRRRREVGRRVHAGAATAGARVAVARLVAGAVGAVAAGADDAARRLTAAAAGHEARAAVAERALALAVGAVQRAVDVGGV